ncbi:MAG: DsrE family protein [Verrucomicrobiota bacterium]
MQFSGKKLGVLISCAPQAANFRHGIRAAGAALGKGVDVYVYCIDEAVSGLADQELQTLKAKGLKLYACAYGAHRHHVPLSDLAAFAGLTVVSDIMASTDRFVSFN